MENVVFSSYFSVYILFPQDQKLLTKMASDSPQSLRPLSCVPHRGPQPRIPVHTDTGTPWPSASSDLAKAGDSHATSGPTKIQCVPGPDYSGSVNLTLSTPVVGTCRWLPCLEHSSVRVPLSHCSNTAGHT